MEIFVISGFINFIIALSLSIVVFLRNRKEIQNRTFAVFAFSVAVWAFGYWLWLSSDDPQSVLIWIKVFTTGSNFLPVFYFYWIISLVGKDNKHYKHYQQSIIGLIFVSLVLTGTLFFSDFLIKGVEPKLIFPFWPVPGALYLQYIIFLYLGLIISGLVILFKNLGIGSTPVQKTQARFILWGSILGFGGGATNFFLWYNIFIPPYVNFTVALGMLLLAYAALRHNLFNIKVIATELLAYLIWLVALIRLLLANTFKEQLLEVSILSLVVIFGILLIRSVRKEVEQRERLQKLSEELKEANERLREFLAFAAHDLKNPIALIKQIATLIYDKTYTDPKQIEEATGKIKTTADRAVRLIESFLDLRSLESGQLKYEFEEKNIVEFVGNVAGDFAPLAEQRGLKFSFNSSVPEIKSKIDTVKIRQVIQNLLDNALKYTQTGFIKVEVKDEGETALISITDSGMGMKAEILSTLFEQFRRAPGVERKIAGTGLGLFISKQFVLGHQGKIWAESDGEGQGSRFFVRLRKEQLTY